MWTDGRRTKSDDNSSHGLKARWAKKGIYVKLLLTMYLQLKFKLILTYAKAAMDNWIHFYFSSNSSHLEWPRAGLSDTILWGTHPGSIPSRFGLISLSGFKEEDLNVIFYQNMPNLPNRYKSPERKISQKNPEYMLNYSLSCSGSYNLSSFWLIPKQQWTNWRNFYF